jgi:hypothetical protein
MKITRKKGAKFRIVEHNRAVLLIILLLLALLIAVLYYQSSLEKITDFASCVDAGNPVMESYPRQCRDPKQDKTFTEELPPIGGETDEYGCLIAAGYTWNQTKQKCVREWEEKLKTYCTEEDRDSDMCIFLWDPVCANAFELPIDKTITKSNGCVACQDEDVEYYIKGECSVLEE